MTALMLSAELVKPGRLWYQKDYHKRYSEAYGVIPGMMPI